MRSWLCIAVGLIALNTGAMAADSAAAKGLWTDLSSKREKLLGAHQEFNITQTSKTPSASQS